MSMKIVVLDGYTLNPGDLSWQGLEDLGECCVYDYTPPEQTLERAGGAEIVLTNKTVLDEEKIGALAQMKYIGVLATGYFGDEYSDLRDTGGGADGDGACFGIDAACGAPRADCARG